MAMYEVTPAEALCAHSQSLSRVYSISAFGVQALGFQVWCLEFSRIDVGTRI